MKNRIPETNSQTTLELRHFINNGACLFDPNDKYPIWKEEDRPELEKKIVEHYAMSQIGFETFGRFKYELNVRMREIMPAYVKRYQTTLFEYNPIENYNMTEGSEDNTTSDGTSSGKNIEKFNETPQNKLTNLDNPDHLTTLTQNDINGSTSAKNNTKHTAWRKGNIGTMTTQSLIKQKVL